MIFVLEVLNLTFFKSYTISAGRSSSEFCCEASGVGVPASAVLFGDG